VDEADAPRLQICAEPLARLNMDNEQFFQVDMDHYQISKFPTRGHPLFAEILEVLNGMLAACRNVQISEETRYSDEETQTMETPPSGQFKMVMSNDNVNKA
jgi:hypothetical protein